MSRGKLTVVVALILLASSLASIALASTHQKSDSGSVTAHAYWDPLTGKYEPSDEKNAVLTVSVPSDGRKLKWKLEINYDLYVKVLGTRDFFAPEPVRAAVLYDDSLLAEAEIPAFHWGEKRVTGTKTFEGYANSNIEPCR